eukprot:CAMPEP_0118682580 /NCGR_PEP_ID=MMETSP0800-20121206/5559_1 /TAXON_ID=210618 ORGANISM="Striatella unipunctata, Strain CCMP2910" /NCGR_SAMPLE_ID=MMETSP0800 /ASSEMBLY_ACC=CAM_ASM_000638 /LENGTH=54 /DNA_ID=CAMNT_0006578975 /DNA_START=247 /DNA_END=411 /DNA_ORIENTATION=-
MSWQYALHFYQAPGNVVARIDSCGENGVNATSKAACDAFESGVWCDWSPDEISR